MISLNEIISVCILFITSINSGYITLSRQNFNAHNLAFSDLFFFLVSEFQQNFQIQVILGSWGIAPQSATCQFFFFVFFKDIEHYGEIFNVFMSLYCCCNSTILCQLTFYLWHFSKIYLKKQKQMICFCKKAANFE